MTEKQKTFLTEEEKEDIISRAKTKETLLYYYDPECLEILLTLAEKAIMKKAVPKLEYDKLKEELRLTNKNEMLVEYHDASEQHKKATKYMLEKCIPKEKVRKVLDDRTKRLVRQIKAEVYGMINETYYRDDDKDVNGFRKIRDGADLAVKMIVATIEAKHEETKKQLLAVN